MAAFTMAYDDGVDIITASIGGPGGFASDPCDFFIPFRFHFLKNVILDGLIWHLA